MIAKQTFMNGQTIDMFISAIPILIRVLTFYNVGVLIRHTHTNKSLPVFMLFHNSKLLLNFLIDIRYLKLLCQQQNNNKNLLQDSFNFCVSDSLHDVPAYSNTCRGNAAQLKRDLLTCDNIIYCSCKNGNDD